MTQTSEWVSTGHPDKMADYIAAHILDRHLERDPKAHVAVEVLLKDDHAVVAGEVTSKADFTRDDYAQMVRDAVNDIGYDAAYRAKWGEENAVCGDNLDVEVLISGQSPDIARGVENGWGDQGIFWGMATGTADTAYLPLDLWLARKLGRAVLGLGVGGLDVKTQISMTSDLVTDAVVAVPLLDPEDGDKVRAAIEDTVGGVRKIVNGTGRYTRHGPIGDAGVTGRKLCVDFYGGNSRIGGGSPWGKDPTKADVTLNLYARKLALDYHLSHDTDGVYCAISCAIGRPDINIAFFGSKNQRLMLQAESRPPALIIDELGLREPNYARMCKEGLFTWKPWK